jgi:hypothetical protein
MRIRSVIQEYETILKPVPASPYPSAHGKAEWKLYGDGTRQCKVKVSGLRLMDGRKLELFVENRRIGAIAVQNGMARYRLETERGEPVPSVKVDEVLQVLYAGNVILEGRFYSE